MERYGPGPVSAVPVAEFRPEAMRVCQCKKSICQQWTKFLTLVISWRSSYSSVALMITLPVGLYFSSKAYVFEGSLGMSDRDSYFYAAIVAVVTVHVVLALFVYVAWNEGSRQWREGKQD
ncbi:vacuolar ATPase assembly integral membrane protein VMA21 [Molothrus ater]|uniref:vacuolar ATPase assembly integral membrane protein VMA21 n=1 Tax=Molothrus ater TaxID=84834 RepID=UPI0023E7C6D8|nr:vacuolar ATPase assembly integral membrane protein VMA21 [Molothrus ater]